MANETGTRTRGRGRAKAAEIDNGGGTATLAKPRANRRTADKANAATAHKTGNAEVIARGFVDLLGTMALFNIEPGDWDTANPAQRRRLTEYIEGCLGAV